MGTIRKRGKKFTVDVIDGAGRRRRCDLPTRAAAEQELARLTLESGQALPPSLLNRNITVREYFGAVGSPDTGWMAALAASVKPRTRRLYEALGRLYVLPAVGHLRVRQLHRAHIKAFVADLMARKLKRSSIRTILAVLNALLSAAVEDGVIVAHPGRGVSKKMKLGRGLDAEEDDDIKPLTADQLARLLAVTSREEPWFYPVFALMALAGLRMGEALALRRPSVDLAGREIRISRTLAPPERDRTLEDRLGTPKSGKARTVDMNVALVGILQGYELAVRAAGLAEGRTTPVTGLMFTTGSGGPLNEGRVRDVFARLLRSAGLPTHHTPHHLRHTFCALLLAEGVPLTYVMAQAGHSSIDVTVKYYGRWLPKSDRSLIDRINDTLAPAHAALAAAIGGASQPVSRTGGNASFLSDSIDYSLYVGKSKSRSRTTCSLARPVGPSVETGPNRAHSDGLRLNDVSTNDDDEQDA